MTKDRTCPHCHEEFKNIDGKVFSNHVRWCKSNPDKDRLSGNGFKQTIQKANEKNLEKKLGKVKPFLVKCHVCGKDFTVFEREFQFPKKDRYFCSESCGHSYAGHSVDPQKISEGVIRHLKETGNYKEKPIYNKVCGFCENEFKTHDESQQFCSISCSKQYRDAIGFNLKIQNASELEREKLRLIKYRRDCQFKFGIRNYPNEFDFKLIEKYGWYSAKNRGNNIDGVSRDHMYSVKEGFLNNIDPKIISHPANCRLVRQRDNASKHDGCSITLEELLRRIEIWDAKYPPK